ncbi:MAG: hypothetical protein ABH811_02650 [archaeon]
MNELSEIYNRMRLKDIIREKNALTNQISANLILGDVNNHLYDNLSNLQEKEDKLNQPYFMGKQK